MKKLFLFSMLLSLLISPPLLIHAEEGEQPPKADSVWGAMKYSGHYIKKGSISAGQGIKKGSIKAGQGIKKGGKATGRAFKKTGKTIKRFFVGEND